MKPLPIIILAALLTSSMTAWAIPVAYDESIHGDLPAIDDPLDLPLDLGVFGLGINTVTGFDYFEAERLTSSIISTDPFRFRIAKGQQIDSITLNHTLTGPVISARSYFGRYLDTPPQPGPAAREGVGSFLINDTNLGSSGNVYWFPPQGNPLPVGTGDYYFNFGRIVRFPGYGAGTIKYDYTWSFEIVKAPTPSTLHLLALGLLVAMSRKGSLLYR